jgi:predicted metal-binding membrane protein
MPDAEAIGQRTPARSPPAVSTRDRALILASVVGVTIIAWLYLLRADHPAPSGGHDPMMAGMNMAAVAPWAASELWLMLAMWTVMMVGMMAPAATPALLLFASAHAARGARSMPRTVTVFALGYAVAWLSFSALAALAQWALHNRAMLSADMVTASPLIGAAIVGLAGVYQLLPLKAACLARCRSPLAFLMTRWRDGMLGAFAMGVRHGGWCLGCCWALMSVLFAVGVMNLASVAALALFVLLEKTVAAYAWVSRAGGVLLVGVALLMLLRG